MKDTLKNFLEMLNTKIYDTYATRSTYKYHLVDMDAEQGLALENSGIDFTKEIYSGLSKKSLNAMGVRRIIVYKGFIFLIRYE